MRERGAMCFLKHIAHLYNSGIFTQWRGESWVGAVPEIVSIPIADIARDMLCNIKIT